MLQIFKRPNRPPDFDFLSRRQFGKLRELVQGYFNARGIRIEDYGDGHAIRVFDGPGNPVLCGLYNIFQLCAQIPDLEWKSAIEAHFGTVLSANSRGESGSFEEIRDKLKIRVNHPDVAMAANPVSWECEGLLVYLVEDFPDSTRCVQVPDIEDWPVSKDELWEIALRNVWDDEPVSIVDMEFRGAGSFKSLESESFFLTTHLFLLDRIFPQGPAHGWLAMIPNRLNLQIFPIESTGIRPMVEQFVEYGAYAYKLGPGSINPHPFWVRNGQVVPLYRWSEKGGLAFSPPKELADLL